MEEGRNRALWWRCCLIWSTYLGVPLWGVRSKRLWISACLCSYTVKKMSLAWSLCQKGLPKLVPTLPSKTGEHKMLSGPAKPFPLRSAFFRHQDWIQPRNSLMNDLIVSSLSLLQSCNPTPHHKAGSSPSLKVFNLITSTKSLLLYKIIYW